MRKILVYISFLLTCSTSFSQITVNLDQEKGVFKVPCEVNGIPMKFIFDTGASNVTISITEANFLLKQGLLTENDIKESVNYQIASGQIDEGTKVILRRIEFEDIVIENVIATVVHEQNAPLLLGMSAINKLGKISIENGILTIDKSTEKRKALSQRKFEEKKAIDWINYRFEKYRIDEEDVLVLQEFNEVVSIKGAYYLSGVQIIKSSKKKTFQKGFFLPLKKIRNIEFIQKESSCSLKIETENEEAAIIIFDIDQPQDKRAGKELILLFDKSIDVEKSMPDIIKSIEYLMYLYKEN
ncbi:retropepsin-like aspartic protease [uncultured Aquimarina sp.]|uniref:retropepsin-like aspartic protease family protein n=1 Tax=uncultured Aquimarina sp. TaxID=575652 RepID=UPI00260A446A|nr:retropepsin-like aspartic protease [uncultured Aquimarina sp.]